MDSEERIAEAAKLSNVGIEMTSKMADSLLIPRIELEDTMIGCLSSGRIPVLVGEPGSGRRSLLRRIASRLADKEARIPQRLAGYRLLSLDPVNLSADVFYAHEYESKIRSIGASALSERVLLVLPSIELFVGSGSAGNRELGDALNLLLSLVDSRGLLLVGTTTEGGWRYLERKRQQFTSRCSPITVQGLDAATTQLIVRNRVRRIAATKGFMFDAAASDALLELAPIVRPGMALPGSACEVLDMAMAQESLRFARERSERKLGRRELCELVAEGAQVAINLLDGHYAMPREEIGRFLAERVWGQSSVLGQIADQLAAIQHGLVARGRPLATLLLTGPTGTGKTETAKAIAEWLGGDVGGRTLRRFDMSEYASWEGAERFIGSQKQMAEQSFSLVDAGLSTGFQVILLDEIEKAHERVFSALLQVLGEGRLSDAAGRTASYENTLFVMTSNLKTVAPDMGFVPSAAVGGAEAWHQSVPRPIKEFFSPEFVNRITAILPFAPLDESVVRRIVSREIARFSARSGLSRRGVTLQPTSSILNFLVSRGHSPDYGARPVQKIVDVEVGRACVAWLEQDAETCDVMLELDYAPALGCHVSTVMPSEIAHIAAHPAQRELRLPLSTLARWPQDVDGQPIRAQPGS